MAIDSVMARLKRLWGDAGGSSVAPLLIAGADCAEYEPHRAEGKYGDRLLNEYYEMPIFWD